MKLVSTISLEYERIEGLKNRKQREGEDKSKASEFSLSMRDLGLGSEGAQESAQLASDAPDVDAEVDSNTFQIEELASAPVNDRKLMEGFEIFGSVFSLLQVESSVSVDIAGERPSLSDTRQLNSKSHSFQNSDVLGSILDAADNSVVIDFANMKKKSSSLPDVADIRFDGAAIASGADRPDPLKHAAFQSELPMNGQMNARGALVVQLHPKAGNPQVEDDVNVYLPTENSDLQHVTINSNPQTASTSPSRVEQVVRFVVEQSADLFGTKLLASERHNHAGLTGKTLRLSLHPAELGGVEVSVSRRGKRLHVTIVPDLESTGRLLLKDSEQLVKRLGLASGATDYVQIQITMNDGTFEAHTSDGQAMISARSERGRDSQNGQHTSSQTSAADQQEKHKNDEQRNSTHADNATRHVGGAIYI